MTTDTQTQPTKTKKQAKADAALQFAGVNKGGVIESYKQHEKDTGSPEVQVALLTSRIAHLTEHLKTHRKDYHSRRGLIMMTNRRRKLLDYLKTQSLDRYKALIERLGLRR